MTTPIQLKVGTRVKVNDDLIGTIKYVGTTLFAKGKWVGVELSEPSAKANADGVVGGKRYFECKPKHGMFVRPTEINILPPELKSVS